MSHKPISIKRELKELELISPNDGGRQFRHGKRIIPLSDFLNNPEEFNPDTEGIRAQSTIKIATGPTIKKGKYNIPRDASMKIEDYKKAQIPQWWE